MTKKKGGGGGAEAAAAAPKRLEQPLQAVLLTEDYGGDSSGGGGPADDHGGGAGWAFHPLSLDDRPRVLCPFLDRAALLDCAVAYLRGQGVRELFVVCGTVAVEQYLLQTYGNNNSSSSSHKESSMSMMQITVIRDATVTNDGDALRELDKRNVLQSDPFLLLHADAVLHTRHLGRLRAAHRARHAADPSAILTLVLQKQQQSISNTGTGSLVVGLDPAHDNRVLVYEDHSNYSTTRNKDTTATRIPCSFLAGHCPTLELHAHNTLADTGLALCSPDVLARFSDEFDYRHVRREFVANAVAEEEEGLQNKVHAVVLGDDGDGGEFYAARVTTPRQYHAVARDVLRRRAHPVVPRDPHWLLRGTANSFLYQHPTARVVRGRRTAVIGPGLLGAHVLIGPDSRIEGSTLGEHCEVAERGTVRDSHLWEHCVVEEGATVEESILGAGVRVRAGAVVSRGCLIGAGCVVGANVVLPEYTRLTTVDDRHGGPDDDDDDWESSSSSSSSEEGDRDNEMEKSSQGELVSDVAVVGPDGKGRVWKPPVDEDSDDEEDSNEENVIPLDELLKSHCIGYDTTQLTAARRKMLLDDDTDSLSLDDGPAALEPEDEYGDRGADVAFGDEAEPSNSVIVGRQEGVDVIRELKIICLEFESGTSPIENLAIELNSFKFSQNASYADCTTAATLAILEKMNIRRGTTDGKLVSEFKALLEQWGPLLQKMSIGLDEEKAIVLALERCAVGEDSSSPSSAAGATTSDSNTTTPSEMSQVLSSGMSFRLLLQMLHDEEIVSEEAVLAWAADRKEQDGEKDTPRGRLFRLPPVQEFLDWLDEESDEEDDDEDEEDDDGEDESGSE